MRETAAGSPTKPKFYKTRRGYLEVKAAGKPVSTSRRAYLTEVQDTIFMAIPDENLARMPLREQVPKPYP